MLMLSVEGLVKDFPTGFLGRMTRILKGVSFSVEEGEIFGFVGPNGAGKTTTFKSILGFVKPTAGRITIKGKPSDSAEIRSLIGYLPESPYFYDYLSGEELLWYMGKLHSVDNDVLSSRIDDLLQKVNMTHARKRQLRKYSKGMLQRIGIAQALINDPEFLILDEPMSGLDPVGRREIMDLILEEKAKGKTILLSSHILADVESLCDRVGVILEGLVVRVGILADLFEEISSDYEMLVNEEIGKVMESFSGQTGIHIQERAGFTILRFDEEAKPVVMRKVLDADLNILSLHPLRKSLEGLFVEESRKTQGSKTETG